jgi:hypothetical protein
MSIVAILSEIKNTRINKAFFIVASLLHRKPQLNLREIIMSRKRRYQNAKTEASKVRSNRLSKICLEQKWSSKKQIKIIPDNK